MINEQYMYVPITQGNYDNITRLITNIKKLEFTLEISDNINKPVVGGILVLYEKNNKVRISCWKKDIYQYKVNNVIAASITDFVQQLSTFKKIKKINEIMDKFNYKNRTKVNEKGEKNQIETHILEEVALSLQTKVVNLKTDIEEQRTKIEEELQKYPISVENLININRNMRKLASDLTYIVNLQRDLNLKYTLEK